MADPDSKVSPFPARASDPRAPRQRLNPAVVEHGEASERMACLLELIAAHAVQLEEEASSFGGDGAEDDALLLLRLRDGVRRIGYMADKGLGVAGRPQVHGDADAWLLPPVWHKATLGVDDKA